jgi:hypothetical protein
MRSTITDGPTAYAACRSRSASRGIRPAGRTTTVRPTPNGEDASGWYAR